jgi:hypothetical protein
MDMGMVLDMDMDRGKGSFIATGKGKLDQERTEGQVGHKLGDLLMNE